METIKLTIPNMKSAHCQMTISQTVKSAGAKVKSITPMLAEVELTEGVTRETLVAAIEKAGYNVQPN